MTACDLFVVARDPSTARPLPERRWVDPNGYRESPPPPALEELREVAGTIVSVLSP